MTERREALGIAALLGLAAASGLVDVAVGGPSFPGAAVTLCFAGGAVLLKIGSSEEEEVEEEQLGCRCAPFSAPTADAPGYRHALWCPVRIRYERALARGRRR